MGQNVSQCCKDLVSWFVDRLLSELAFSKSIVWNKSNIFTLVMKPHIIGPRAGIQINILLLFQPRAGTQEILLMSIPLSKDGMEAKIPLW